MCKQNNSLVPVWKVLSKKVLLNWTVISAMKAISRRGGGVEMIDNGAIIDSCLFAFQVLKARCPRHPYEEQSLGYKQHDSLLKISFPLLFHTLKCHCQIFTFIIKDNYWPAGCFYQSICCLELELDPLLPSFKEIDRGELSCSIGVIQMPDSLSFWHYIFSFFLWLIMSFALFACPLLL